MVTLTLGAESAPMLRGLRLFLDLGTERRWVHWGGGPQRADGDTHSHSTRSWLQLAP